MQRRGLMFVLSSPSGAGKTTLSRRLQSVTTRLPRPGEVDGKDYFFIDRARYDAMVAKGELLEHAQVFDHCYGTPRAFVEGHLSNGVDVLFDIDWQGTRQLRETMPADLVGVFILPPSILELERRLRARAQDDDATVRRRMCKASDEISHWGEYDYVLINDDFDATLNHVASILDAERLKRSRQLELEAFIEGL
jgi:guanylate kinase